MQFPHLDKSLCYIINKGWLEVLIYALLVLLGCPLVQLKSRDPAICSCIWIDSLLIISSLVWFIAKFFSIVDPLGTRLKLIIFFVLWEKVFDLEFQKLLNLQNVQRGQFHVTVVRLSIKRLTVLIECPWILLDYSEAGPDTRSIRSLSYLHWSF